MWAGTRAVPLRGGLGATCESARQEQAQEAIRVRGLRDRLWAGLRAELDELKLNGDEAARLPGNLNVSFAGVEAQALLLELPHIGISAGSACHAGSGEPSAVLRSLGLSAEMAHGSVRFGLGRFNTEQDVDEVCEAVCGVVRRLRSAVSSQRSHRA